MYSVKFYGFQSSSRGWVILSLIITVMLLSLVSGVVEAQTGGDSQAAVEITNICDRRTLNLSTLVLGGDGFEEVKRLGKVELKPGESKTFDLEVPGKPEALIIEGMADKRRFDRRFSPLRMGSTLWERELCLKVLVNYRQESPRSAYVEMTEEMPDGTTKILLRRTFPRERLGISGTTGSNPALFLCPDKGCLEGGSNATYRVGDPVHIHFGFAREKSVKAGCRYITEHLGELSSRSISVGGTIEEPDGQRTLRLTVYQGEEAAKKGDRPIAAARCSFAVTEGAKCECGKWGDRDGNGTPDISVNGSSVNNRGSLTLSEDELPVTVDPDYTCVGDCSPNYSWFVGGPDGFGSSDSHVSSPFTLSPSSLAGPGSYTLTVVAHCNGKDCSRFQFQLRVKQSGEPGMVVSKKIVQEGGDTVGDRVEKEVCQNAKFRVAIMNTGNSPISEIFVSDSLPPGLEYVSGSSNYEQGGSSANPTWYIPDTLQPGGLIRLTFSAHVVSEGRHENCVKVRAESGGEVLHETDCATVVGKEGGQGCRCGQWGGVEVEYYSSPGDQPSTWTGNCGDTLQVTHAQAAHEISVTSDLNCINCPASLLSYSWEVTTPGIGTWGSGDGNECSFSSSSFDEVTATLHATCGREECPSCHLLVEYTEGKPDVVVDSVEFDEKCNVKVTICNVGTADVDGEFFFKASPIVGQSGSGTSWMESISGLAAGSCTTKVLQQPNILGSPIDVIVDPQHIINEIDESNNDETIAVPEGCQQDQCSCGRWIDGDNDGVPDVTVEGSMVSAGGTVTVSTGDYPIEIVPSYQCEGGCDPDFDLFVDGDLLVSGQSAQNLNLASSDLTGPGSYGITLLPHCDDHKCGQYQFKLTLTEEISNCGPDEVSIEKLAGEDDDFDDDQDVPSVNPRDALLSEINFGDQGDAGFDFPYNNRKFVHTFKWPNCEEITQAWLEIKVKALPFETHNDWLHLWTGTFSDNSPGGVGYKLWSDYTSTGTTNVIHLDLGQLPAQGTDLSSSFSPGTNSLLSYMTDNSYLDVYIQDDTSVDYANLYLCCSGCMCGDWPDSDDDDNPDIQVEENTVNIGEVVNVTTNDLPLEIEAEFGCQGDCSQGVNYEWYVSGTGGFSSSDGPLYSQTFELDQNDFDGPGEYEVTLVANCDDQVCEKFDFRLAIEAGCSPGVSLEKLVQDTETGEFVDQIEASVCTEVKFLIKVHNTGTCVLKGINVKDELPDCLEYLPDSADADLSFEVGGTPPEITFLFADPLSPGDTATLTFEAHVISEGENRNCATLQAISEVGEVSATNCATVVGIRPCSCEEWEEVLIDNNPVTAGGTIAVDGEDLPVDIDPSYVCEGSCQDPVYYNWKIEGMGVQQGFSSSDDHVTGTITLDPGDLNGPGEYEVTLVPHCDGQACDRFVFTLKVRCKCIDISPPDPSPEWTDLVAWWPFNHCHQEIKDGHYDWWTKDGSAPRLGDGIKSGAIDVGENPSAGTGYEENFAWVSSHPELNFGKEDFSIDTWIKPTENFGTFVDKRDDGEGYALRAKPDSGLFKVYLNGWYTSDLTVDPDRWNFIGVIVNRHEGKMHLRVNGDTQMLALNGVGDLDNSGALWFGRDHEVPADSFDGLIDEAEIYSAAMDPEFFEDIFAAGYCGKCYPHNGGHEHKMTQPMWPYWNGWDVECGEIDGEEVWLADDWECDESGPVSFIQFWGSWEDFDDIEEEYPGDAGTIKSFEIMIAEHDGDCEPGEILWRDKFTDFDVHAAGDCCWLNWYNHEYECPGDADSYNHKRFYRYRINKIPDPFEQKEGKKYWLIIKPEIKEPELRWGWASSKYHRYCDAVWGAVTNDEFEVEDKLLRPDDCNRSLDLAFYVGEGPYYKCKCGKWKDGDDNDVPDVIINNITYTPGSPPVVTPPVNVVPYYKCEPSWLPECMDYYFWTLYGPDGDTLASTATGSSQMSPLSFDATLLEEPGTYMLEIVPECDGHECEPFRVQFQIKGECDCGDWNVVEFSWEDSAGASHSSTGTCTQDSVAIPELSGTVTVDSSIDCIGCGDIGPSYSWNLTPVDPGSVLPSPHSGFSLPADFTPPPGEHHYHLHLNALCGDVVCPQCVIALKVFQQPPECPCPETMEYHVCQRGDCFDGVEGSNPRQALTDWVNDHYAADNTYFYPENPDGCNKLKGCDDETPDRYWAHTFHLPVSVAPGCDIESAQLKIRVKNGGGNDTLRLGVISAGGWAETEPLSDYLGLGETDVITLNLSPSILSLMETEQVLDIAVQDDSSVDWAVLKINY